MAVKYASPRIGQLPAADLLMHTQAILFRISAITGWKLPDDETYIAVLEDEFSKYLTENHSDMNVEEITFAVRNYGLDVQDWGKSINLQLINQPIARYRGARIELSQREERLKEQATQLPAPAREANWQPIWEDILQAARTRNLETKIIGQPVYEWLIETGQLKLSVEDRKVLFINAKNKYQSELVTLIQLNQITGAQRAEYEKIKAGEIENDLHLKIAIRAKIQAVKEFALETVKKEKYAK